MKIILFLLFWAGSSFNSYTQSIEKTIIKALDLAEKGKYGKWKGLTTSFPKHS